MSWPTGCIRRPSASNGPDFQKKGGESMNITPIDIQQAGFKVRLRGYDRQEVDTFLDLVTEDFETLIRENGAMKEKIADLETQLAELKKKESSLNNMLVRAEEIVGQIQQSSKKESDLVIKEAEIRAEEIVKNARLQAAEIYREMQDLKKRKLLFIEKMRSLIGTFQKVVDLEAEQETKTHPDSKAQENPSGSSEEMREHPVRVLRPQP
jgi:cell division initiation protein